MFRASIVGCYANEVIFMEKEGIFLLFDLLEVIFSFQLSSVSMYYNYSSKCNVDPKPLLFNTCISICMVFASSDLKPVFMGSLVRRGGVHPHPRLSWSRMEAVPFYSWLTNPSFLAIFQGFGRHRKCPGCACPVAGFLDLCRQNS